jgi:hypothetical protein
MMYINGQAVAPTNLIKEGHNYSTDEQVIGTWIDGKPLYEKTIIVNHPAINGVTTLYDVETNIPEFEFGFIANAFQLADAARGEYNATQLLYGDLYWGFDMLGSVRHYAFGINQKVLHCKGDNNTFNNLQWIFIIRYTKTTD